MPTITTKSKPSANDRNAILAKAAAVASEAAAANNNKRKRQSSSVIKASLDIIPNVVQHHVNVINIGGCPRCNCTQAKLAGKSSGDRIQKYGCKNCKKVYHENTPRPTSAPVMVMAGGGVPSPTEYQVLSKDEQMYMGKERLQQVATRTYAEITNREIHSDKLAFEQQMKVLQNQLKEKRRNIYQLLGLHYDDEEEEDDEDSYDDNAPLISLKGKKHTLDEEEVADNGVSDQTAEKKSSDALSGDAAKEDKSSITNEATKAKSTSSNPFRDAILLLRRETHKLEQRVSAHQQQQQAMIEGEDDDVDITNDDALRPGSNYQLASRVVQEDGDEITIYEVGGGTM